MESLKSILLSVFSVVLSISSVYILQMFLNAQQIKLLLTVMFFTGIILVILSIVQILRKRTRQRKLIKTKFHSFLFIISMFLIITGTAYVSVYNIAMHEVFGDDLTISQKIENRKLLKQYNKSRKQYNSDIDSYIKGLNEETIEEVSLYYNEDIDPKYPGTIKDTIPLAKKLTDEVYGRIDKEPLKVILYNEENWNNIKEINNELVQGFFDGENIRIKGFLKEQTLWHMKENFIHEYAHYALDMYRYQNNILAPVPSWFNEGVAEYIAVYKNDRVYSLDYIRHPVDLRILHIDEDFWASLEEGIDGEEFYDPYMYSYYMIDSLVDLKGEGVISSIILKSKEMDFYEAFQDVVGVSIEEYQGVNLGEYVREKINSGAK